MWVLSNSKQCFKKCNISTYNLFISFYAQCDLHLPPLLNEAVSSTQKCLCVFLLSISSSMTFFSCSLTPVWSICLELLCKLLLQKVPFGMIYWVAIRTLRRPFILVDQFWCSFLQMILGYPTCVGRSAICKHNYYVAKRLFKNFSHNFALILHFLKRCFKFDKTHIICNRSVRYFIKSVDNILRLLCIKF